MAVKTYQKGSEWIKWDLHIHTPYSICNQQYGNSQEEGTWEKFIKDLESLPVDFKVIGINDYLFIDGYEKVKKYKESGRLKNIDLILPIIELRLKKFAGNEKFKKINYHIIFSDQLTPLTIKQQFLSQLYGKFQLSELAENIEWSGAISEESLKDLGNKIKQSVPKKELDKFTESDLELGFNNLCFNEEDVKSILNSSGYLKDDYLTAIGKAEWEQFEWNDNSIAEKRNIVNSCNFVFISAESVEKFNNARNKLKDGKVNSLLLDCSDAHSYSDSSNKDKIGKCFTWIKSIPTFNGLKQILYEKERVYIGEESPTRADLNKTIKSLIIEKSNSWFDKSEIQINPWSVSMIGGKGTGKTAMLDIIALTANKDWKELEENRDSFLKKAKKELHGLSTKLVWCDGSEDICELDKIASPIINKSKDFRRVVYLSQGFISKLCSNTNELQRQIEAVIYQNVKNEDRIIYSNFDEYKNSKLNAVKSRQNELRGKLNLANEKVNQNVELISQKEDNKKNIELKGKEVLRIDKEIKKISTGLKEKKRQELFKEYQKFGNEKSELEKVVAKQREDIRNIDLVLEKITSLKSIYNDSIEEINSLFRGLDIKSVISIKILPENISKNLNNLKKKRKDAISNKVKELSDINSKINALAQKLELEKSKQDKLSELSELHKKAKEEKASFVEREKKIADAELVLAENKNEQKILLYNFFVTLFQEKEILEEIYKPLESILEKSEEENKNFFRFSVALGFDYEVMADKGNALIDHRKSGKYLNTNKEQLLIDLRDIKESDFRLDFKDGLKNKELSQGNKRNTDKFLASILNLFHKKDDGDIDFKIKNQLSMGYSMRDFYNWVFSTEYYKLSYTIKFNDKDLDSLSPGLKGVALLILYLELDKEDNRPILIDQPEENLDNRFIYNTLVKYFKIAKKRRQVIIATHNANLVVNTDSEQVFVANFDKDKKEQKNYISYVSGAIEDTFNDENGNSILESKGIREHIIDVLEGSEDAFKKRERRYNLSSK